MLPFKKKRVPPKSKKTFSIGSKLIALFSVIGTVLASIGQGVAIAIEGFVDIPHQVLISSPFDLIELSTLGALQMMSWLVSRPPEDIYVKIGAALLPTTLGVLIFLSLLFLLRHRFAKIKIAQLLTIARSISLLPEKTDSNPTLIAKTGLFAFIFNVTLPALAVLATFFLIAAVGLLVVPISLGMKAGQEHIRKYVIEPAACAPLKPRNILLQPKRHVVLTPKLAQCVAVENDRRDLGRGRVVLTSSTAMVLYDPVSGRGWRVPTKDLSVETVDTLILPKVERSSHHSNQNAGATP